MSPRRRLLLLIAALIAVTVLALGVQAVRMVAGPNAAAPAQDRPGPVLLVPGYGGGTSALDVLRNRLQAQGRQAEVVRAVGSGTGDLREQATALDAAVNAHLAGGAPSVDIVGFSAGGVVARLWVVEHGGRGQARRIVTLGSPHHGTALADLSVLGPCSTACRQLAADSDLLTSLNRGDETPDGPRWTSIYTRNDRVVMPPQSAQLAGAANVAVQDVCPGAVVTHDRLPVDPVPVGLALLALGPGLDGLAPATQCERIRALGK